MIRGPQIKDADAYQALLGDTNAFFKEIKEFFERRVRLLKGTALAETRFVTAFFDEVALVNIDKALSKLEGKEASSPKLPRRVLHYLARAQEFLSKATQNSIDGAQFIPVPFHTKVAGEDKALLDKCNALIERAKKTIEDVPDNAKSWFSYYLNLAILLPDVRAAGFGLDLPVERSNALNRLEAIEKQLTALQLIDDKASITKATKRKTGCESFNSLPQGEFHQYVPPLNPIFDSFKRMMQQDKATLSKAVVHAAVATVYPTPVLK